MAELETVLQLGPALSVRGGVSSVERLIVQHLGSVVTIKHVATMEDGSLWRKLRVFARAIVELRRALRSPQRLVVHIHFASRGSTLRKCILAWLTLRAHRPLILHAHGASFDEFFGTLPRPLQQVVRAVFARADCFLVLSSQWRQFYTQQCGLPAARVMVLYNPTSLPESIPVRSGRANVQLLFLGRIGARKGAFDLLQAYTALPATVRERTRLVFAGDGEVESLRAQAAALGAQVEVHAWVDARQRDALLAESDIFVLPSHSEGVPMAMLEAMASGLPVVTTPVGGIPDVVADRCEGLMVAPGQIQELGAALQKLIEDEPLRLRLGRHARMRAENFDIERYSADLARIYRRLLSTAA